MALTHQPCPDCGHESCMTIFDKGNTYCFSCNKKTKASEVTKEYVSTKPIQDNQPVKDFTDMVDLLGSADYKAITDRGITSATAKKYSTLVQGDRVHFAYFEPNEPSVPVAVKTRLPNKQFPISGEWKKGGLFGQHLFSKGGKYITLVEGEFDALAAYQMNGSKYPVVSIRNGASSAYKDCQEQLLWLDSFEKIVICFDADKPGQAAAKEVASLFGDKASIMKHDADCKDACDYLKQGKTEKFKYLFWNADQYIPEGLINGSDLWEEVNVPPQEPILTFPFNGLNKMTDGIRAGEVVSIGAGSGVGKTAWGREMLYHALKTTDMKMGVFALEDGAPMTAQSLMSLELGKKLHVRGVESTEEERWEAFKTLQLDRTTFFRHHGSMDTQTLLSRVNYMIKSLECQAIILDHISIIVSSQQAQDERKAIDEIMTKLTMIMESTGAILLNFSHLNRPESGAPHEEGGRVQAKHFRGSGSIYQLSDLVLGIERNCQHEDPYQRNLITPRVLKARFLGDTGEAPIVYYNKETGRMSEEPGEAI